MSLWEKFKQKSLEQNKITSLSIEVTNSCNLRCDHCYKVLGDEFFPLDLYKSIIDEAEELGVAVIGLNGGEPAIHPDFLEFCLYPLKKGMMLSINSNGLILSSGLLEKLKEYSGVKFQISLYGFDDDSSKNITGQTSFSRTFENIKLVKKMGFDLEVVKLARNDEVENIPELFNRLNKMEIKTDINFNITPKENGDISPLKFRCNDEELNSLLKFEDEEKAANYKDGFYACGAGVTTLSISVEGEIKPCLLFKQSLGNIKQISLKEAINSQKLSNFKEKNLIPETCKTCEDYGMCVRCPATDIFETADITKFSQENCRIAKLKSDFTRV
jgi:radical SAM protein with 4Fe4S-binding SPASM domain